MYYAPTGNINGEDIGLLEVLSRNHEVDAKVQVESADGAVLVDRLEVVSGSVVVDRTAAVRRRLSMRVSPYAAEILAEIDQTGAGLPVQADPPDNITVAAGLKPYGQQARVWRGVRIPGWYDDGAGVDDLAAGGSFYYFPLGVFRLADLAVEDSGSLDLQVDAYDMSRAVARNRFDQPWIVAAGTNIGDAITAVVQDRLARPDVNPHSVEDVFPGQVIIDAAQDPWEVLTGWAQSISHEAYFDANGRFTIAPVDEPGSPVVATYQNGENAVMVGTSVGLSDDPGHNGVILTSESATLAAPIRAEAWDTSPSSPTYYLGAYGRVPKFVSNPYVATQAQADAAAAAELDRILGATERLSFVIVPNPAHEAGDVVRVVRDEVFREMAIESMTIPLQASDTMQVSTKEKRVGED